MRYGLRDIWRIVRELRALEKRTITMSGRPEARYLYQAFTGPHPVYKVIRNKTLGVALLDLPGDFETFLKGPKMNDVRNKRSRATRTGHAFRAIHAPDHLEDILAINQSSELRDGRPMPEDYLRTDRVQAYLDRNPDMYGVFGSDGRLCAYIHVEHLGEVCVICRLLGHKEHLNDGVMFLMISELVRDLIANHPETKYLMYDMWMGAAAGYRQFKEKNGFRPFRVKWRWQDPIPDPVSEPA